MAIRIEARWRIAQIASGAKGTGEGMVRSSGSGNGPRNGVEVPLITGKHAPRRKAQC
ncbi:hypothetical protein OKW37_005693 [Paraburkholderia sp. MM5482-R2]